MAVTSLAITQRSIVLDGRPFGDAGVYEKIVGVLRLGADPAHPANQGIADLALGPRSAAGLVESSADFYLLKPVDPARGNRRLLLDVPNRGRKVALAMLNSAVRVPDPTTAEDFGNGFLMRHGYTVAWCGWQHDVPRQDGLMALTVPLARRRRAHRRPGALRVAAERSCRHPADGRPLSHRPADRRSRRSGVTADRARARRGAGDRDRADGVALLRRDARGARRRLRAWEALRARLPRREPAACRPRAPRRARHRGLAPDGRRARR